MKKLLMFLILGILLFVPMTSAFEFDNYAKYEDNDMKVKIKDSYFVIDKLINWGKELGEVKLTSHHSVDEIKSVLEGKDRIVMTYDFSEFEKYKNGIGEIKITNMDTGKVEEKAYKIVELIYAKDTPIYEEQKCQIINAINGSFYEKCDKIQVGTRKSNTIKEIIPYNSKDIPNRDITLGLMVDVNFGDYYDAIWEIAGVKLNKHAEWNASIELGNTNLWQFDEDTGTTTDDFYGLYNITGLSGAWKSGILGSAYLTDNSLVNITGNVDSFTDVSINIWLNRTSSESSDGIVISNRRDGTYNTGHLRISTNVNDVQIYVYDGTSLKASSGLLMPLNNWTMITAIFKSDNIALYKDGVFIENVALDGAWVTNADNFSLFTDAGGDKLDVTIVDEIGWWNRILTVGDIKQLWNSGVGITTQLLSLSPTISITYPTSTNYNYVVTELNYTSTSIGTLDSCWYSLDLGATNSSRQDCGTNWAGLSSSEGSNTWTVYGNVTTGEMGNTTVTFSVDTINPAIVINYPNSSKTYDYILSGTNLTLNTTITDTNLQTCWFNYNNTNTTFPCSSGVLSTNQTILTNETILKVYANDSSGNWNSSTLQWTYDLFDFNEYTYNKNVTESSSTTISGLFQTGSAISSSYLQYNNTNYSTSIVSLGGNRYTLSSTLTSPTVTQDTNATWFFIVNNVNSTPLYQTVVNINMDDCSSYTFIIVNYTLENELTQAQISHANSTIESSVILKTQSNQEVVNFNQVFTGTPNATVCSESNLSNSGLKLWEQSRYGSNSYVYEQHNLQKKNITGQTDIILRDLPSTSATTFRIIYKSSTYLPVPDAVVNIQRKYIGEGVYKEIESPITDANGEASASLDLNSVIYRILMSSNGVTIATFENPAIACQNILTGDCVINLNERQSVSQINNFDIENDFTYSLSQNNRTISLIFEIPSGTSKTVNLYVNQSTILGNKTACSQSLYATSGRLDCVIGDSLGDVFFSASVYSGGTLITNPSGQVLEDRSTYFGTDNIVLTFFLVLSIILLTISDPIALLFGIIIGLIGSSLMLLLNSGGLATASVLMYLVIGIIILIIKISNRINR